MTIQYYQVKQPKPFVVTWLNQKIDTYAMDSESRHATSIQERLAGGPRIHRPSRPAETVRLLYSIIFDYAR